MSEQTCLIPLIIFAQFINYGVFGAAFKDSGYFLPPNPTEEATMETVDRLGLPVVDHAVGKVLANVRREVNMEEHNSPIDREEEEGYGDSPLADFLEIMAPHLFLIPFLLQAIPFAIPAVPLSYILSVYEPEEIMERLREIFNIHGMTTTPHPHVDPKGRK